MRKHRVAIFGGNFDPFHYGHLNSMLTVAEELNLDEVRVVPAAISPLRIQTQGSTPEHRVEMLKRGIAGHEEMIKLDTREIDRGGLSYTIETVESLLKEKANEEIELFLIIGMDQFSKLDQWKNFDKLLGLVNLVVTSRPGTELPYSLEDWPLPVRNLVGDSDSKQAVLKNGRSIYFMQLEDVEASGTEIRRKLRFNQDVRALVPPPVADYIAENKLFEGLGSQIGDFEKFTAYCEKVLNDKGGVNVKTYDLRAKNAPSEFTLICSGTSTRHASALAEHLVREVKKDYNVWPQNMEGQSEGRWIVVDYGALIVHTFYDFVRQEYRLEEMWSRPHIKSKYDDRP